MALISGVGVLVTLSEYHINYTHVYYPRSWKSFHRLEWFQHLDTVLLSIGSS